MNWFSRVVFAGDLSSNGLCIFLQSIWKHKDHPNLKIIWYEDMKENLIQVIREVASFTGYHLTELKILQLDDHLYIDNFRQVLAKAFAGFDFMQALVRKGKVGDWKNHVSKENVQIWDEWIAKNLQGTNIKLPELVVQ